jgi:hypothetical protein
MCKEGLGNTRRGYMGVDGARWGYQGLSGLGGARRG